MKAIKIEWLYDDTECDQAGCSGGYATGARVTLDGKTIVELIPRASCFGSEHDWCESDVYAKLFEHLGYKLESEY